MVFPYFKRTHIPNFGLESYWKLPSTILIKITCVSVITVKSQFVRIFKYTHLVIIVKWSLKTKLRIEKYCHHFKKFVNQITKSNWEFRTWELLFFDCSCWHLVNNLHCRYKQIGQYLRRLALRNALISIADNSISSDGCYYFWPIKWTSHCYFIDDRP